MVFGLGGCVRRWHGHMAADHPAVGHVLTSWQVIGSLGAAATEPEAHNRMELDEQHGDGGHEQMTCQNNEQIGQSSVRGSEGYFL